MQISEAESVVMEILWARHPRTSEEVVAALADAQDWQEATINTLPATSCSPHRTAAAGRPPLPKTSYLAASCIDL